MFHRARSDSSRIEPAAIVAAARACLGVPFRHQGRTDTGLDCIGLGMRALADAGLKVEAPTAYRRQPDPRRLIAGLDRQLIRLGRDVAPAAGMVALFRGADWLHVGIIAAPGRFIHARGPEDVGPGVIEHLIDAQSWGPRLKGLWRHPGMVWGVH